jgi:hypothetical protein
VTECLVGIFWHRVTGCPPWPGSRHVPPVQRDRGLSNGEIADHLHLSPATVKTHVGNLLAKPAARDRAQLVMVAYETGLVTPTPRRPPRRARPTRHASGQENLCDVR